jgi:predicted NBD/HSP70 family sugar kinase
MSPNPKANRDLMRAMNRSVILNQIKANGPIARADVARATELSPATVTAITAELIEEGFVYEKAAGDSSGGRPPILLAINPLGGYVVGVKLMEDHAIGALTDLEANILQRHQIPLADRSVEVAVKVMADLVEVLLSMGAVQRSKLIGVGVGLAGIVDSNHGILRQSPYFGWRDKPIRDLLQVILKAPVFIDNDVNTFTLAERWFGCGQDVRDFLTVTIGRGVGLGIVTNGQFYRGTGGGAGEFGHIVVDPEGPICDCGKRGCLEALVSDPALLAQAKQAVKIGSLQHTVDRMDDLIKLAQSGNMVAVSILHKAGAIFGQSVANLVNIFNPARILVSGEGVRNGAVFFNAMRTAIQEYSLAGQYADLELQVEPWGDDIWARGAASLVLQQLFVSPVANEQSI